MISGMKDTRQTESCLWKCAPWHKVGNYTDETRKEKKIKNHLFLQESVFQACAHTHTHTHICIYIHIYVRLAYIYRLYIYIYIAYIYIIYSNMHNTSAHSFICEIMCELNFANHGDPGGTVVKVLCYKSEGRWFDPSWCHWNFSLT